MTCPTASSRPLSSIRIGDRHFIGRTLRIEEGVLFIDDVPHGTVPDSFEVAMSPRKGGSGVDK